MSLYNILQYIPKNLLSFLCGLLARLTLPAPFGPFLNQQFVRRFGIDMSEAALPLSAYRNIEAVFTRALAPGKRPIAGPLVSPADGYLSYSQPLSTGGEAIQAKGLTYSPRELVWGPMPAPHKLPKPAWFSTIYLAPDNYHRVHSPVGGTLVALRYIPGELWPVNDSCVPLVPRLFCRNERLIFEVEEAGGGMVYVVMVGALNVGRIVSRHWPEFASNNFERQVGKGRPQERRLPYPQPLAAGDELGIFMLGSTVVVIYSDEVAGRFKLRPHQSGKSPIRMGQSLCE